MAMLRFGSATIIEPNISPDKWTKAVCCGKKSKSCNCGNNCKVKVAKTVFAAYKPERYLLSHCTIIAAVDVDLANPKDKKSDYLIKPEYSQLVNNNGDAWTLGVIKNAYKTFIGAQNYLEHVQISELSKGRIIDAVLREVPIGKDKEGKELTTYYVDILVATDRKHSDLVNKISSGELSNLSMGCKISFSRCSKCGKKAVDDTETCDHIRYEKNNTFMDANGIKRKVAELCGHESDIESVRFIEASWVRNPAFTGAVIRNVVEPPADILAKLEKAHKQETYQPQWSDYLKAAAAEDKPEDAPAEEAPAEEAPAETPEETPAEPPAETPPPEEPEAEPSISDVKKTIKKKLLDQIVKELTEEPETERPVELETLDESIIKPASIFQKMWVAKKSWDGYLKKTAGKLSPQNFKKLRYGTMVLMTSPNFSELAKHGYNKRDFLAVLSYLDNQFKKPLDTSIKKVIAGLGGTQKRKPLELLGVIATSIGRKLSKEEAAKALHWLKALDYYKS